MPKYQEIIEKCIQSEVDRRVGNRLRAILKYLKVDRAQWAEIIKEMNSPMPSAQAKTKRRGAQIAASQNKTEQILTPSYRQEEFTELCDRLKLRRARIAHLLGVSLPTLNNWQKQGTRPRLQHIQKIRDITQMDDARLAGILELYSHWRLPKPEEVDTAIKMKYPSR